MKGTKSYRAAGGVVVHDGAVLLLDRPGRGEVRLPKGHVEPGENAAQAALREVREETGYAQLRVVRDLGTQWVEFDNPNDGYHYRRQEHYFLMCLEGPERAERPAVDAQFISFWASFEEAIAVLTFESERAVVQRAEMVLKETPLCGYGASE
ncbi:MAG: NUDIX domain-containing protein [Anaerolineae bacterium]|nr:NUDIX domain-containing protein [Anaerolineae bacterium]